MGLYIWVGVVVGFLNKFDNVLHSRVPHLGLLRLEWDNSRWNNDPLCFECLDDLRSCRFWNEFGMDIRLVLFVDLALR